MHLFARKLARRAQSAAARVPQVALVALALFVAAPVSVCAQGKLGTIQGSVTTQKGSVRLPGALVTLRDLSGREMANQLADADGRFRFADLPEGRYRVSASLDGFQGTDVSVALAAGRSTEQSIDMPIASVSETVEVVAPSTVVSSEDTISGSHSVSSKELEQLAPGGGFQSALRLLASVIEVPGGLSIKGGRPSQASVQLGPSTLVDPSTGLTQVSLPDDAIDSVAVLPNPYAVEFGRFSSGLVVIQTRRAGDQWKTRLNNLDPTFRTRRGQPFDIMGIASFGPRLETGGPIISNRLFVEQTAQYRYGASDVPSRPQDELRTSKWFSSFTRVDANLSPRHSLVATGGFFPSRSSLATLGTFTPPDATVDIHGNVNHGSVTERSVWTDTLISQTTVQMHEYRTEIDPQASLPMRVLPETTLGSFFNRQRRDTASYQWIETLSGSRNGPAGLHLFKVGVDLLHSRYDGSSASGPVLILRSDETLARRLDFLGPTRQEVHSTDVAMFAQDRVQPTTRWYVEFGGRVDRDGVVDHWNVTPRVGSALLLNASGTTVLRGGLGLFYERTPSTAGAFGQFESAIDARFASDGVTRLGLPIRFDHVTMPDLQTPRSVTWDAAFDHRLNRMWSLHFGVIDRRGSHELIVDPISTATAGEFRLESTGRSSYREAEATVRFAHGSHVDVNVSYVRSAAMSDSNALTNFFDSIMWPVIGANAYGPANADVPHRLFVRGHAMPTPQWLVVGILDWRSGLPYSVVNEALDFAGPRNDHRFPSYLRLELGLERRFKIFKYRPWIGVRADNALNSFLPTDVQSNIGSPAFGSFYNSEYRQFRLQVRFER